MTKRPFSPGMELKHKRSRLDKPFTLPLVVPQFDSEDGVNLPEDIADLCSNYMDDDCGASLPVEDSDFQSKQHRRQEKEKIKQLKVNIHALQQDLKRSRRAGCKLESDMARLRHQRLKELSYERRTRRELHSREEEATIREKVCERQQQNLECLETRLQNDMSLFELNEVKTVMRNLVDEVELSARETNVRGTQADLAWLSLLKQDQHDYIVLLEKKMRETEEFAVIEQHLLNQRIESLTAGLQATQRRLQDEERATTEMKSSFALLQEELTLKSEWLTGLALGSMSMVNTQDQIAMRVEAERAEWQRHANQVKQTSGELQAELTKQLNLLQVENAQLQEQLRVSELSELNSKQKLQHAQQNAKTSKAQHAKIRSELKTLQDRFKTLQEELAALQCEAAPSQLHVPVSVSLSKVNPERLQTLRSKDFIGKRTRDESRN